MFLSPKQTDKIAETPFISVQLYVPFRILFSVDSIDLIDLAIFFFMYNIVAPFCRGEKMK